MNPEHPKAIEAAERAEKCHAERQALKRFVQELHDKGVRWVEVEPVRYTDDSHAGKAGRMSIAYFALGKSVVAVATALCHPEDNFDKLRGRGLAGINLSEGRCIILRRPSNFLSNRLWLSAKFTEYAA